MQIKMAVTQALRDQQAELEIKYEEQINNLRQQNERELETERKQVEILYEQK